LFWLLFCQPRFAVLAEQAVSVSEEEKEAAKKYALLGVFAESKKKSKRRKKNLLTPFLTYFTHFPNSFFRVTTN
jgi:hypothetical protein